MGAFAMPLAIAAGATSAAGTLEQAQASSNAADYQSQVARNNSIIQTQNAAYATSAGAVQAEAASLNAAQQVGYIRTVQAANGLDVNSGSPLAVQETAAETGRQDTLTVANDALLKAYGYNVASTSDVAQSSLDQSAAQQDITGGYLSTAAGALSNASALSGSAEPSATPFDSTTGSDTYNPNSTGWTAGYG